MTENITLNPHQPDPQALLPSRSEGAMASGFTAALDRAAADAPTPADDLDESAAREAEQREQVREAAAQLVASAFVLPMLQQIRDDPLGSDLFKGGVAEDLFGQQLDTHLADDMAKGMNTPLVDAVERYLMGEPQQVNAAPGRELNLHG